MKACILVIALLQWIFVVCEGGSWSTCRNGLQTRQIQRTCTVKSACTSDRQRGCGNYVKFGYCAKTHEYSMWMKKNCCASCKKGKKRGGNQKPANKGGPLNQKEIKKCLASVNGKRAKHVRTGPLVWDEDLADKAQRYAQILLNDALRNGGRVNLEHDPDNDRYPKNGENLFYQDNVKVATCSDADNAWYDEINDYSYSSTDTRNGKPIGHFTQMVWRKTTKIGVGIAVAKSPRYGRYGNKLTVVVAKYIKPGNFNEYRKRIRDYTKNVARLKSRYGK